MLKGCEWHWQVLGKRIYSLLYISLKVTLEQGRGVWVEAGANCEATVLIQTQGRVPWTRAQLWSWSEGAGLVTFVLGLSEGEKAPGWSSTLLMTPFPPVKSTHITDAGIEFKTFYRASIYIGWDLSDVEQKILNHRGASSSRRIDDPLHVITGEGSHV